MVYTLKIASITPVTHNVRCIRMEKPEGYNYVPGQATDVCINKDKWKEEKRPFTFTSLNSDPYLELTIKCYTDHDGMTNQVEQLIVGDELILEDAWGAIEYKGEGYFIAGGAGITPFIAILRELHKNNKLGNNKLFFSNKTPADIIYEKELKEMLGDNAVFIVTEKGGSNYPTNYIDEDFLKENVDTFSKHFYVCGPDQMIKGINDILEKNGASPDNVVFEK